jgi:tRNA pseudouridine38-40 synthase
VHAAAQVVHVDLPLDALVQLVGESAAPGVDCAALARALNARLDREVRVWRCRVMDDAFDARHCALARRYRYRIGSGWADPLERTTHWQIEDRLDLSAMRIAADALVGAHDFAAFCRLPSDRPDASLVRRVDEARLIRLGDHGLSLEIEANAFCHQMVRSIVGMLVAIGLGRLPASALFAQLRSRRRDGAPALAPAHGLSLVALRYPEQFGGTWSPAPEQPEQGATAGRLATRSVVL